MPVSGNGWPLSPSRGFRTVPGTSVRLEVVNGPAGDILMYVAEQFHKRVEPLSISIDDWGYSYRANVNNPTQWSNHASATAIDLNAIKHANGLRNTFSSGQVAEIRKILDEVGGVVRWGGDFRTTKDEMHFEINASPAKVQQAWNALKGAPTTTTPPPTTTPPTTTNRPTLEPGATGTDVELVQRFLGVAKRGDPGYGHYGPATTSAVQRYQQNRVWRRTESSAQIRGPESSLVSVVVLAGTGAFLSLLARRSAVARAERQSVNFSGISTKSIQDIPSSPLTATTGPAQNGWYRNSKGDLVFHRTGSSDPKPGSDLASRSKENEFLGGKHRLAENETEDTTMVKTWTPNRKVVAAAVSGLVTLAGVYLFGPDLTEETTVAITTTIMTIIGYLVPLPEGETPNGNTR